MMTSQKFSSRSENGNEETGENIIQQKEKQESGQLSSLAQSVQSSIIKRIRQEVSSASHQQASISPGGDDNKGRPRPRIHIFLVASVSGGCDSMALFHACKEVIAQQRKHLNGTENDKDNGIEGGGFIHMFDDDDDDDYRHLIKDIVVSIELHVVHFHHRQRNIDADKDCQFVQEWCQKGIALNNSSSGRSSRVTTTSTSTTSTVVDGNDKDGSIPFHVFDWRAEMISKQTNHHQDEDGNENNDDEKSKQFTQDLARNWRRRRLLEYTQEQLNRRRPINVSGTARGQQKEERDENNDDIMRLGLIMTAHHRNDSEESLLLKWLRGVHVLNFSGISEATLLGQQQQPSSSSSVPPSSSSSIWLIRPFLHMTKQSLINYLLQNKLSWREDKSNQSSKYLRNRIRNELIPLLHDLSDSSGSINNDDGSNSLSTRLENLMIQSEELQMDIRPRVQHLLQQVVDEQGYFHLDRINDDYSGKNDAYDDTKNETTNDSNKNYKPNQISRLLYSQVIHQWMTNQINAHQESSLVEKEDDDDDDDEYISNTSANISFETLQRVVEQLERNKKTTMTTTTNSVSSFEWTLELGSHWNLIRKGSVLQIKSSRQTASDAAKTTKKKKKWSWKVLDAEIEREGDDDDDTDESILISIPTPTLARNPNVEFVSTTVKEFESKIIFNEEQHEEGHSTALRFYPPWRNSSIKLRQFLRGQNIPLYQRDDINVLYLTNSVDVSSSSFSSSPTKRSNEIVDRQLVAVQIDDKKWIVNKPFSINKNDNDIKDNDTANTTMIRLSPECFLKNNY